MAGLKDIGRRKISVTNISFKTVSDITGSLSVGGSVFITSSVSSSFGNIHTLSGSTFRANRLITNRIETNQISGSTLTFNTVKFHSLSGSTGIVHNLSSSTMNVNDLKTNRIETNQISGSTGTVHNLSSSTMDVNDLKTNRIIANDIRTTSSITQAYGQYVNSFTEHANSNQNTYFGLSVAMKDATTVYVSADEDSVAGIGRTGVIYKFNYTPDSLDSDGSPWVQDTNFRLTASDLGKGMEQPTYANYGKVISAMGNYVAVSAPNAWAGGRSNVGKVYVVRETGDAYRTEKVLVVSGTAGDQFGITLSLANNGTSLAVGTPLSGAGSGLPNNKGRVFVYRSGTMSNDWGLEATLDPSDGADQDHFGHGLSFSGSYLAVGAPGHNTTHPIHGSSTGQAGAVYIFNSSSAAGWAEVTKLTSSHVLYNANFGRSVKLIDDNRVIIGETEGWNHNHLGKTGSVHIEKFFETGTNRQKNLQVLRNPVTGENNYYGAYVASSGSGQYIAVSRPIGGNDTGNDSTSDEGNRAVLYYASGATSWTLNQTFTRDTTMATYYANTPGTWVKNHITPHANPWTPLDMVGTTVIHGIPGASDSNFHDTGGSPFGYNFGEFRVWQLVETGASSGTISGSSGEFHHLTASRITTTGKVGIKNSSPTYPLDVTGDINASGDVRSGGSALTSDQRLKENVTDLNPVLDSINLLNPVKFDWKKGARTGRLNNDRYRLNDVGLIAQEVSGVFPSLVSEGEDRDRTLGLNYSKMVAILTKAVQELNDKVVVLENIISGSKK